MVGGCGARSVGTTVASDMGKRHNFSVLEFSRNTEAIGDIDTDKGISYKELAHMIMEADRSQDLQLANWRPRKADGRVPGT